MLQKRWFYVALGLIVVVVYARLFLGQTSREPAPAPASLPGVTVPVKDRLPELEQALEPSRVARALNAHPGLMVLLSFWSAATLLLVVGGIILNARAASLKRLRRIFRYRTPLPRVWSLRDVGRLTVLLVLMASLLPFVHIALGAWNVLPLEDRHLWSLIAMFVLHVWVLLVVAGMAAAKSVSLAKALGWPHASARGWSWRSARRAVRVGLTGYVALVPWILGLLWLILTICQRLGIEPPMEPIQELLFLEGRPAVVAMTVVLACVVGPVVEEVLFRGILFSAVRTQTSRLVAMLISGGIFSALHTNLVGFLPILVLGCLLADLYERTGSLLSCISVHIVHNVVLMGFGLILKALLQVAG